MGCKRGLSSVTHPIDHLTEEKAVGVNNSLLMFCTSCPSFSVSTEVAIHSGSLRKAAHRCSRSAMLFHTSM